MPSIYEIFGNDAHQMTISLMEAAKVSSLIPRNASIALKPNLVIDRSPDSGATTHPGVLSGCIEYLQTRASKNLRCVAPVQHHIGGLHKFWDGLIFSSLQAGYPLFYSSRGSPSTVSGSPFLPPQLCSWKPRQWEIFWNRPALIPFFTDKPDLRCSWI